MKKRMEHAPEFATFLLRVHNWLRFLPFAKDFGAALLR
jgi:hypothetical protein